MLNPFITLSPDDVRLARELARIRYTQDRTSGVVDLLQGTQDRKQDYEYIGAAGEIAFARWYGIPFTREQKLIPGACDFTLQGVRLDVKATDRRQGSLIIPLSCRPGRADLYVYVSFAGSTAEIVGFIPEAVVFQDRYLRDLGRGLCRVIPRADLYHASQLAQAIRQLSRRRNVRQGNHFPGVVYGQNP